MTTVEYTDRRFLSDVSSFVDSAFFNAKNGDLVLNLKNVFYRYANVPVDVYNGLVSADSVGRYYADVVQPDYGPAERLGPSSQLVFVDVSVKNEDVWPFLSDGTDGDEDDEYDSWDDDEESWDDPDSWDYPDPEQYLPAFNEVTKHNVVSLNTANSATKRHEIRFMLSGSDLVRVFNVQASDVDSALVEFNKSVHALQLKVVVKSVTIHFE